MNRTCIMDIITHQHFHPKCETLLRVLVQFCSILFNSSGIIWQSEWQETWPVGPDQCNQANIVWCFHRKHWTRPFWDTSDRYRDIPCTMDTPWGRKSFTLSGQCLVFAELPVRPRVGPMRPSIRLVGHAAPLPSWSWIAGLCWSSSQNKTRRDAMTPVRKCSRMPRIIRIF